MRLLAETESVVLGLLIESDEMYGLQMVKASNGHLKRGTIYVTLARMIQKGYLTFRAEAQSPLGMPRRFYQITAKGKRALQTQASLPSLFPEFA